MLQAVPVQRLRPNVSESSGSSFGTRWDAAIRAGDFPAAWAVSDAVLATRDPARFAQLTEAVERHRAEKDAAEHRWLEVAEMAEGLAGR